MAGFELSPKFKRVFVKKPPRMQAAIMECILRLEEDPRHPGLRTHRVQGEDGVWEAYVDRSNRVTFEYDVDGTIRMRNNCNHDMLLKNP